MKPVVKPSRDKLNHCWAVRCRNATQVQEKLADFVDARMDRGYRLRHTVNNGHVIVSQNSMYDVSIALRFLKQFELQKPIKIW